VVSGEGSRREEGNEAPTKLLLSAPLYLTYSLTYSHTRSRARALATYWKLLTRYVLRATHRDDDDVARAVDRHVPAVDHGPLRRQVGGHALRLDAEVQVHEALAQRQPRAWLGLELGLGVGVGLGLGFGLGVGVGLGLGSPVPVFGPTSSLYTGAAGASNALRSSSRPAWAP